jgi:hypothetical protein
MPPYVSDIIVLYGVNKELNWITILGYNVNSLLARTPIASADGGF